MLAPTPILTCHLPTVVRKRRGGGKALVVGPIVEEFFFFFQFPVRLNHRDPFLFLTMVDGWQVRIGVGASIHALSSSCLSFLFPNTHTRIEP